MEDHEPRQHAGMRCPLRANSRVQWWLLLGQRYHLLHDPLSTDAGSPKLTSARASESCDKLVQVTPAICTRLASPPTRSARLPGPTEMRLLLLLSVLKVWACFGGMRVGKDLCLLPVHLYGYPVYISQEACEACGEAS